ncbi:mediator of RNA polymerase II transcription subunit 28-like [Dreissena polymorpha]|uniref:Mediator of RNA polymerase II transcription subunit 28 n=1 Tax=Dreissena polymorpha TaxID=45954 RepID=A0A9D4IUA4_DREPO|nr:mediator of RNA polymerase II transcription subunit 28-like [Dreissena polymorpha]KAH3785032.1 hypothetical protein DPMN_163115 [Dreissena polymorpha]
MAAPMDNSNYLPNSTLIDDLESSFLNCITLMTSQEPFNVQDAEETKTSVENAMQKFLELSRQTEAFFLRKRMLISFQKPEDLVKDEINDLKTELARKEQLLDKHAEKLKRCQVLIKDREGGPPLPPQTIPQQQGAMGPLGGHPTPPPHSGQAMLMGSGQSMGHLPQYSQQLQMSQHAGQGGLGQGQGGLGPGQGGLGPGQGGLGPGQGQYQTYQTSMHPSVQGPMAAAGMQPLPMGMGPRQQPPPSYPQGPLAYLEQTTSNIGLPDRR